ASSKSDDLAPRVASRLEEASRKHPEVSSLRYDLANLYSRIGRFDEAEAIYREILKAQPSSDGTLNNLAWLIAMAHGQSRAAEALDLVGKAISIAGPIPDLLDTRAISQVAAGRGDLAIKDLEAALATAPSPDKYIHLAQARLVAKDRPGARA